MIKRNKTIRDAIKAKLVSVNANVKWASFERYSAKAKDFQTFYVGDDKTLFGGFIRRVGFNEAETVASAYHTNEMRWEIHLFMGLTDSSASEEAFDNFIDDLSDAFRADQTLGNVVLNLGPKERAGLQLASSGPVMFAGILSHSARFDLTTTSRIDISPAPVDGAITSVLLGQSPNIGDGNEDKYEEVSSAA